MYTYYSMCPTIILNDPGPTTVFKMRLGEMGVTKFLSEIDAENHHFKSVALKQTLENADKQFVNSEISQTEHEKLIGDWCDTVEQFADEYNPDRVPFDIRDSYNECNRKIKRQGITWPEVVEIEMGDDFDMSDDGTVFTYTGDFDMSGNGTIITYTNIDSLNHGGPVKKKVRASWTFGVPDHGGSNQHEASKKNDQALWQFGGPNQCEESKRVQALWTYGGPDRR
jgi:hypothetical protein